MYRDAPTPRRYPEIIYNHPYERYLHERIGEPMSKEATLAPRGKRGPTVTSVGGAEPIV